MIANPVITGITAPVTGEVPTATIASTDEYTATISWSPTDNPFLGGTVYTATITITPKSGYTLGGVSENFFTVAGATATNSANDGVVTAVFPATVVLGTSVSINVFLEGPNNGSGAMTTILPGVTSGDGPFFPLTQPYSGSPWHYSGTETVATVPAGVVDWVLLELRSADTPANATAATIFSKRAAFLRSDGSVVDLDGTSPVLFPNPAPSGTNIYVVVKHRNHVAIMSNIGMAKNLNNVYVYDFTDAAEKTYGQTINYVGGKWSMFAGDIDQDGTIQGSDLNAFHLGFEGGYYSSDLNMDGNVWSNDRDILFNNFGFYGMITD